MHSPVNFTQTYSSFTYDYPNLYHQGYYDNMALTVSYIQTLAIVLAQMESAYRVISSGQESVVSQFQTEITGQLELSK